jgi:hypothetical protein
MDTAVAARLDVRPFAAGCPAMMAEDENSELEAIAKAFRTISKEISYGGLAQAVLQAALLYCGAARGAVLLSE